MKNIIPISIWSNNMINCFLIKGNQKYILVDTGVPDSEVKILEQLKKHQIDKHDIVLIIITHSHVDHFGSVAKLKELLNVPVLAHELDIQAYLTGIADTSTMKINKPQWWFFKQLVKGIKAIPFSPEIVLKDNTVYDLRKWGVEGKVIHTPGHTPGSLSVILENGEAIIMDMMASGILLGGLFLHKRIKHPPFHDNLNDLKMSFDKVLAENIEEYYLGHGRSVNRKQVLKYYKKYLLTSNTL